MSEPDESVPAHLAPPVEMDLDTQFPTTESRRTEDSGIKADSIPLELVSENSEFVPELGSLSDSRDPLQQAVAPLSEAVVHERAVAMFAAGPNERINFVLDKELVSASIGDVLLVRRVIDPSAV